MSEIMEAFDVWGDANSEIFIAIVIAVGVISWLAAKALNRGHYDK